jgi:AraC family transcriptional activator of pobA
MMTASQETTVVPSFFLYGEPPRHVAGRFLHLEALADRSGPSDWNIRAHAHDDLNHVFHLRAGSGEMRTESGIFAFIAPSVLLVPARLVHAFHWVPDSSGHVLTLSDAYLEELCVREPGFRGLFLAPDRLAVPDGDENGAFLNDSLNRLGRELSWRAPGHASAVDAQLLNILVAVLRLSLRHQTLAAPPPGPQAELLARFRHLLETDFRKLRALDDYAARLGVTQARLRAACVKLARQPPHRLLQERLMLEAKRLLLYTNMTIAEAAYDLGFDDPAYFSRLFHRMAGESPRAFRKRGIAG